MQDIEISQDGNIQPTCQVQVLTMGLSKPPLNKNEETRMSMNKQSDQCKFESSSKQDKNYTASIQEVESIAKNSNSKQKGNEFEDRQKENDEMSLPSHSSIYATMASSGSSVDDKVLKMMQKMGYKLGSGLGKNEQGITETIKVNTTLGKRGLGCHIANLNLTDETWDFSQDDILVEEKVHWLENQNTTYFGEKNFENWIKEGPKKTVSDLVSNSPFCDKEVLLNVFKAKDIFGELDLTELEKARSRANPFETIRYVFFMNRAALKMANIDAACDFLFTKMEQKMEEETPVYFADVCAGPGGFTEYILWRKEWLYKGFGLTLKDGHDFKVMESTCASSVPFQALYGKDDQGDVCNPDNLIDFTERVKNEADGKGVHFMMSDGGFCVDGQENEQEVLSKNIYLCQCLLALNILRPRGSFVTKTFDIFTPFSIGLLYLMYLCFDRVGIIKPNSSRPANSERYFVCNKFRVHSRTNNIRQYLWKVAIMLWENKNLPDRDITELVPIDIITEDKNFFEYILESNTRIGKKQITALKKLATFCRNPNLVEERQGILRKQCLNYWNIPDQKRKLLEPYKVDDVLAKIFFSREILQLYPRYMNSRQNLETVVTGIKEWHYAYLYSAEAVNRLNFYAGVNYSKVYRLQNNKWVKIKDIQLVKGTLLYGDFVKETIISENNEKGVRYSLQVIDAVFLGSMDLQGCTFQERQKYIHIYCKSVNRESQSKYSVRVRPKVLKKLEYLPKDIILHKNKDGGAFSMTLPTIGYKSLSEKYEVNSILLIPTNNAQTFQSTHLLRVQIFNTKDQTHMSFDELSQALENLTES